MEPDCRMVNIFRVDIKKLTELAETIKVNNSAPDFVKQRFDIIKKLIVCSYYCYEFLDVAFEHSLLTIEGVVAEAFMRDHNYKVRLISKKGREIEVKTVKQWKDIIYHKFKKEKFQWKENKSFQPSLGNLLIWVKENYNLQLDDTQLEVIKELRNYIAHPANIHIQGPRVVSLIKKNADFINALFP